MFAVIYARYSDSKQREESIEGQLKVCHDYCKELMIGHSSNKISKGGIIYNYYKCKNSGRTRPCKKENGI